MLKQLIIGGVAVTSLAACGPVESTLIPPASPSASASASPGAGIGDGAPTYVSQFRRQFPWLAGGKTDRQILSDGEADCADMAAARKLTTPAMAKRYGLGSSTADQFTLSNIVLLATFTLCGIR
jgi:hypothetical protein